jgi:hypothetical protein
VGLFPYSGLPFKFKVIAINYQGSSIPSSSIRILAAEIPSAPVAPMKVAAGKTFITVRWLASNFTGGVPIIHYNIYVKPQGGSFILAAVITDFSDLVFTQIVPNSNIGNSYEFLVTATNEVGESLRSISTTIIAGVVPGPPLNLQKVSADAG